MNLWWGLFGVADTALGGWIANAARLLTIAVAILLTTYRDRFWRPLTNEGMLLIKQPSKAAVVARATGSLRIRMSLF